MSTAQTREQDSDTELCIADRREESRFAPPAPEIHHGSEPRGRWRIATGIFLLVLSVYVLTSPGRIDIIDGQTRFDVAYNWIVNGRPVIRDPWIGPHMGVVGRDGLRYSFYGAPGSVFALPLVWLGIQTGGPDIQPSQFLFSLTSSIFGAGIASLLFFFYLELGVTTRKALIWTLVSSFATYVWPISNSTFDNAQHAFFALAALYFGFLSARRRSPAYAALGGLMAGVLFLYQEYFLLIVPALAISTLKFTGADDSSASRSPRQQDSRVGRVIATAKRAFQAATAILRGAWNGLGDARSSGARYCAFIAATGVGVFLSLAYNDYRFGSWFDNGKVSQVVHSAVPFFGNPIAGFLTLLVSPGKSVFLYSPALILGVIGVRQWWRRKPELFVAVAASSLILVGFISCITFAGGDWCWGPRYLTLLLPLWALGFPFVVGVNVRRELAVAVIAVGFLVQAMALSVENQRFFFERGLNDYFWAEDSWTYFKRSALFARPEEVASLSQGVPPTARLFNSIPIPDWSTYTILGPPVNLPRRLTPLWIRDYKIYFLARPWPLWMWWLPPSIRPVNILAWLTALSSVALAGIGLIYQGLQRRGNA